MKKTLPVHIVIERLNLLNNMYDYSQIIYKDMHTKVKVICKKHGCFEQTPINLLNEFLCKICKKEERNAKRKKEVLIKCGNIHLNKYDYSNVEYETMNDYVIIICPIHGEFKQTLNNHMYGEKGCPKCSLTYKLSHDDFIRRSEKVHNYFYDYNKTNFEIVKKKVVITCPKHGDFKQTPNNHLKGIGCPMCSESQGEKKITSLLLKNNIEFIRQHKFENCKSIRTLPFDFYLPKQKLCIEFDGRHHFEAIEKWGGEKNLEKIKKHDLIKENFCKQNGFKLIRISYLQNLEEEMNKFRLIEIKKI
jgi:very-short-patch-repair endonuclease/uncharacterized C2H2 Zn-finger protein